MAATRGHFDPDQYRMTIGEHLEELRTRMILALTGFCIVLTLCLVFVKDYVFPAFCKPLTDVLKGYDLNAQLVTGDVSEGFMLYIKIALITAAAISSPWIVYQIWLFIAAGLYPNERKYVTRYLPLSITLLISGMLLVYFLVLPWTLQFLIGFSIGVPLAQDNVILTDATTQPAAMQIPELPGDPARPLDRQIWYNSATQSLKFAVGGKVRLIPFGSDELIRPEITVGNYIDTVVAMLLAFGLSFQMPLVILALERIGIVDLETLKKGRRYAIFIIAIAAAAITPGADMASMIGLMVPLILLYELGIFLARSPKKGLVEGKDDQ
jgi:sec-independent protein translocase protein TatC